MEINIFWKTPYDPEEIPRGYSVIGSPCSLKFPRKDFRNMSFNHVNDIFAETLSRENSGLAISACWVGGDADFVFGNPTPERLSYEKPFYEFHLTALKEVPKPARKT